MSVPALIIQGDVGPVTGNVRHGGDVRVFGSVRPGFRVEADGDVRIFHHVRAAEVFAGRDLHVAGIVAGPDAVLDAVGSISARHVADARLVAGFDIEIAALAERCELVAGRRVAVCGNPGLVIGGLVRPGRLLTARRLLPSGGRPVVVRVGFPPFAETREDLVGRLSFARSRAQTAESGPLSSAPAARRQAAEAAAFRSLIATLSRRLRQIDRSGGEDTPPGVRILERGPVTARIWLDGEEWKDDTVSIGEADRVDR